MTIVQLTPDELRDLIASAIQSELAKNPKSVEEKLLTRIEAAKMLGVSLPTLNAWEKAGQITPKRIGNRVFFRYSDLVK